MDTKKLRQKILDLAIRGKLVPQDPNDEPASLLLERIRAEKERLIKEGKIKRSKKTAENDDIEAPFEIPESWEWIRFGEYLDVRDGTHDTPKYVENGYPFVTSKNLSNSRIDFTNVNFISESDHFLFNKRSFVEDGDILFAMIGSIGNPVLVKKDREFSIKNVALFKPFDRNNTDMLFVYFFLCYFQNELKNKSKGGMQPFIPLNLFRNDILIPIPPIREQNRITSEIERWFAVIDELESNEDDLVKAIDKAKSKILDLAIHGKLVPQDPNDEPAIELLKRINPMFEPCNVEDCPFAIPPSWEWTTIGMSSKYKSASIDPSKYKDQDFELYSVPSFETGMPEVVKGSSISSSKKIVKEGDVLVCKINPHLNRIWIVEHHNKDLQCIASSEWIIFRNRDIDSQYLMRCFSSSYFLHLMLSNVSGVGGSLMRAQPASVEKYLFPLPPLAEQKRIVAKIEEVFKALDALS